MGQPWHSRYQGADASGLVVNDYGVGRGPDARENIQNLGFVGLSVALGEK